jgi:hypothetical protein
MNGKTIAMTVLAAVLGSAACGGGDGKPDARRIDIDAPNRSQRAYLVKRTILPTSMALVDEAKFDYPGSGIPVNKLGAMTKVLLDLMPELDIQGDLDDGYARGDVRQVIVFNSAPLDQNDGGVIGFVGYVVDADDPVDVSNDFEPMSQFRLEPGTELKQVYFSGSLADGVISTVGDADTAFILRMPFFADSDPLEMPGVYAQIRLDITEDGATGEGGSAITLQQVQDVVFPMSARYLTEAIAADVARKDDIKNLFDENNDDVISLAEVRDSPTMATLAQPDMDLDGDSQLDHLSQGVSYELVRVQLVD